VTSKWAEAASARGSVAEQGNREQWGWGWTPTSDRTTLAGKKEIRYQLMHPTNARVKGKSPWWELPDCTGEENRFFIDWAQVDPRLQRVQVASWELKFYADEADPNFGDKPRLDFELLLADGNWIRWHPDADPIWSTDTLPTRAMTQRRNRQTKLMKNVILSV